MNSRKNEKVIQSMREVRVSDDLCVGDVVKRVFNPCHGASSLWVSPSSAYRRKKATVLMVLVLESRTPLQICLVC